MTAAIMAGAGLAVPVATAATKPQIDAGRRAPQVNPGDAVTVHGRGFGHCGGKVTLSLVDGAHHRFAHVGSGRVRSGGSFSARALVPRNEVTPGRGELIAACRRASARTRLFILNRTPQLVVAPQAAAPGGPVAVTGANWARGDCAGAVALRFVQGGVASDLGSATIVKNGSFAFFGALPAGAAAGPGQISASQRCRRRHLRGHVRSASAPLRVLVPSGPLPPVSPTIGGATSARAGSSFAVTGSEWQGPSGGCVDPVQFSFEQSGQPTRALGNVDVDANGDLNGTVRMPASAPGGSGRVVATQVQHAPDCTPLGTLTAAEDFNVTRPTLAAVIPVGGAGRALHISGTNWDPPASCANAIALRLERPDGTVVENLAPATPDANGDFAVDRAPAQAFAPGDHVEAVQPQCGFTDSLSQTAVITS